MGALRLLARLAILMWIPCALICDLYRILLVYGFGYHPKSSNFPALVCGHLTILLAAIYFFSGWDLAAAAAAAALHRGDIISPPIVSVQIELRDSPVSILRAFAYGSFLIIASSFLLIGLIVRGILALFLVAPRMYVISFAIMFAILRSWE